jgi:hypothetical protein
LNSNGDTGMISDCQRAPANRADMIGQRLRDGNSFVQAMLPIQHIVFLSVNTIVSGL